MLQATFLPCILIAQNAKLYAANKSGRGMQKMKTMAWACFQVCSLDHVYKLTL